MVSCGWSAERRAPARPQCSDTWSSSSPAARRPRRTAASSWPTWTSCSTTERARAADRVGGWCGALAGLQRAVGSDHRAGPPVGDLDPAADPAPAAGVPSRRCRRGAVAPAGPLRRRAVAPGASARLGAGPGGRRRSAGGSATPAARNTTSRDHRDPSSCRLVSAEIPSRMAMTLRLADDESEALRRRADREGRSMQEVARQAVREYVETHSRAELLDHVLDQELPGYAEALERLGQ